VEPRKEEEEEEEKEEEETLVEKQHRGLWRQNSLD
jgi:hypothetical protein